MMLTSTASPDLVNISIPNAAIVAVLGYFVVFVGLILLMLVTKATGRIMSAQEKKKAAAAPAAAAKPMPAATPAKPAPGTAGELKLHDVPPRVAAQLMAIVAYKTGKPVNELRFRSIREIKE